MPTYLRNAWYAAAWSSELLDGLLARTFLDEPVVIYRDREGGPVALQDRCPHRFAPLSRGAKSGDEITCGYHGLRFDRRGTCVHNPFAAHVPAAAKVRAYPVVERHALLWIWIGQADLADAALVPDMSFAEDRPGVRNVYGYLPMQADYELGTDNLMDLSHIEFVHTGSFAGAGVIFAGKHSVREADGGVDSNWDMPGIGAPPPFRPIFGEAPVDHWLHMHWQAPATMRLNIGVTPAGGPPDQAVLIQQAHILTPETATSCHYFWSHGRNHDLDSAEVDAGLRETLQMAFLNEDKPMIEAVQRNMRGDFWDEKPVLLTVDAGAVRVRRVLADLIKREGAAPLPEV